MVQYEFDRVKCKNGAYGSSFQLFFTINKSKKKYNYLFYSSGQLQLVLKLKMYEKKYQSIFKMLFH